MQLSLLTRLLDLFFPRSCILCQTPGEDLCKVCIPTLSWPKPKRRKYQWMTALWNYRDARVRHIVVTLKNKPHVRLAQICAGYFMQQVGNLPHSENNWIIVPIPISSKRRRERGYNQSELLATAYHSALIEQLQLHFPVCTTALVKQRTTLKQGTTSSREERIENMRNVFTVRHPHHVTGTKVIIIDDVTTTGATLADAKRALLEAGALKVLAWTIAN